MYKLEISNSHYIITTQEGKNLLIDTGSPISFSNAKDGLLISLGKKDYTIQQNITMIDKINNSGLVENNIDAILGMDILCNHTIEFDKTRNIASIDTSIQSYEYSHSVSFDILNTMGQQYVLLTLEINHAPVKAILDTGAWISYLASSYLTDVESIGTIKDYNPILGDIHTTKHMVTLSCDGHTQNISVAKMPSVLEQMMNMMGIEMILGLETIKYDKLCLNFVKGCLIFK